VKAASAAFFSSYVSGFGSAIVYGQCRAVIGRGSWSAAFRRPQFKQANTVIASPASKSTARSGNMAPWHLSHVFMAALYHFFTGEHILLKYWTGGQRVPLFA
jgi:hypothetical protein